MMLEDLLRKTMENYISMVQIQNGFFSHLLCRGAKLADVKLLISSALQKHRLFRKPKAFNARWTVLIVGAVWLARRGPICQVPSCKTPTNSLFAYNIEGCRNCKARDHCAFQEILPWSKHGWHSTWNENLQFLRPLFLRHTHMFYKPSRFFKLVCIWAI